jgi:hypothetical protein
MIISVINHTHGKVKDDEVQRVLRAINRQIREDFEPYWSFGAELRLEGRSTSSPTTQTLPDMRGDAVIYLWDQSDVDGAIGYHEQNNAGIPFGFVFTDVAKTLGEPWSVTLSHEALELVGDPEANLLVMGPHPAHPNKVVFHWFEMCDAVQNETYTIDTVTVSNFVLPLYFTVGNELGSRNDFLGRAHGGKTLESFKINPGGYVGYFDPATNGWETFSMKGDKRAETRLAIKSKLAEARRGEQYKSFGARAALAKRLGHDVVMTRPQKLAGIAKIRSAKKRQPASSPA